MKNEESSAQQAPTPTRMKNVILQNKQVTRKKEISSLLAEPQSNSSVFFWQQVWEMIIA